MKKLIVAIVFAALIGSLAVSAAETNESVDKVVLASTANYPDALVSSAPAGKLGMPILLTNKNEVPEDTLGSIEDFSPEEVVMVGGPEVISEEVEQKLSSEGYNVTRLWGATRYGTANEVADYFWPTGSEKALIIENTFTDRNGKVLAAGKEVARDEGLPIFLTPKESIPASTLTKLQELEVDEVTYIGSGLSENASEQLEELQIDVEEVTGENDTEIAERIRNKTRKRINSTKPLKVVAAPNFNYTFASVNSVSPNNYLVGSEEEIDQLVEIIQEEGIGTIRVVGEPDLSGVIASEVREQTDAEVVTRGIQAGRVPEFAANFSSEERQVLSRRNNEAMRRMQQAMGQRQEYVRNRVNRSLDKARDMIDENASEEAKEALEEAERLFNESDYEKAREEAQEALSEHQENEWREIETNRTRVRRRVRGEAAGIDEKINEIREMNREFAEEMRNNMTVEERLSVIDRFRDKRRKHVKDIISKTAPIGEGTIKERLDDAEETIEERGPRWTRD